MSNTPTPTLTPCMPSVSVVHMTTVTCESINPHQMLTADPIDARLVRIGTTGDMWRVAPRVAGARTIIEAHHATTAITMTGWVLTDAASAKYTFPAKPLAAGATILIHSGTGTDTSTDHYANWGFVWNNSTDTATLTRPDGTVADTCTYTGDSTGTTKC